MDDLRTPVLRSAFWADREDHRQWLRAEGRHLLRHYAKARVPGGFATLGNDGTLVDDTPQGIITARKVHCYSLASLMGLPGSASLAEHGVAALLDGPLRDRECDGWFADAAGPSRKKAYLHAFMGLAGASATMAGIPRGDELMQAAVAVIDDHFWIEAEQVMQPSFAADWSDPEAYRGANCNMHTLEACLALLDATDDTRWLDRALALARRFGHEIPSAQGGTLPEHFSPAWEILPDYGSDQPADDTRPWGLTPGHHAEWGGLLLKVEAACLAVGRSAPAWLLTDAIALFDMAVSLGWAPDGHPGMVYTVGFDGAVSVANRAYWVQAELANTALMLLRRTGEPRFEAVYRQAWDFIADRLIDPSDGSWRHEIDAEGALSRVVYPTREDLYHDFQATITPLIPVSASLAGGILRT